MSVTLFKDLPTDVEFNFEEGLVVGKFAPSTMGHINLIHKSATACKHLTVAMCFDEKWLSQQSPRDQKILTKKNRLIWLKTIFAEFPHITIKCIDETNLPAYPNGWAGYANLLRDLYGGTIPEDTAIFSSEVEYDDGYSKHLPELKHVVVDNERTEVPISATMVRNDLYTHWELIPSCVRKSYALNVLIFGTESAGKTTLTRSLAKLYGTSWTEEYGRQYCLEKVGGDEQLLTSADYENIAFTHKTEEEKSLSRANKVTFTDSNAFVTEFYHRLYTGEKNELVSSIAKNERYDLILYLSDETTWVDDGLRVNSDNRSETRELFEEMLEEFPNQTKNLVRITGKNIRTRHEQAISAVKKLMASYNKN